MSNPILDPVLRNSMPKPRASDSKLHLYLVTTTFEAHRFRGFAVPP
ncbi:hypothetical protein MPC1_9690002 [Methylocella tundrae]|nr:hypothetical protein MPC1_9690002 [Methylocella tundrae]